MPSSLQPDRAEGTPQRWTRGLPGSQPGGAPPSLGPSGLRAGGPLADGAAFLGLVRARSWGRDPAREQWAPLIPWKGPGLSVLEASSLRAREWVLGTTWCSPAGAGGGWPSSKPPGHTCHPRAEVHLPPHPRGRRVQGLANGLCGHHLPSTRPGGTLPWPPSARVTPSPPRGRPPGLGAFPGVRPSSGAHGWTGHWVSLCGGGSSLPSMLPLS